jgi:hypothetical protein
MAVGADDRQVVERIPLPRIGCGEGSQVVHMGVLSPQRAVSVLEIERTHWYFASQASQGPEDRSNLGPTQPVLSLPVPDEEDAEVTFEPFFGVFGGLTGEGWCSAVLLKRVADDGWPATAAQTAPIAGFSEPLNCYGRP